MSQSRINTGGPAFPIECYLTNGIMQAEGMSLRAHFAGHAVQGLTAFSGSQGAAYGPHELAKRAYEIADAMLEIEATTYARNAKFDRDNRDEY